MKILIPYASAGAGHRRAAEAIYDYLKSAHPDYGLKIIDVLDKTNALFRFNNTIGYSILIKYAVGLWNFAFWLTEFKFFRFISSPLATFINNINSVSFIRYLIRKNPDVIISTHFLPSDIASLLKRHRKIKSKLVTVITDFGVHPFWISKYTDLYIVASDFTKERLLKEGVKPELIKVFGLPFHPRFLKQFDRKALARKLGISGDKFTVLLMTGSFGIGPLEKVAELLHKDVQVLVVCATNERLKSNLDKRKLPNVKVYGFVNNTEELMAVSDLIVTKAGGSTIAEVVNMDLVPVFISVIPGQESGNVQALRELGVGLTPRNLLELKEIVLDFKSNTRKLDEMKERIESIKKPLACQEIADALC
jgi:processive 1,2-diacylglycerol beta-glucosyltransferase